MDENNKSFDEAIIKLIEAQMPKQAFEAFKKRMAIVEDLENEVQDKNNSINSFRDLVKKQELKLKEFEQLQLDKSVLDRFKKTLDEQTERLRVADSLRINDQLRYQLDTQIELNKHLMDINLAITKNLQYRQQITGSKEIPVVNNGYVEFRTVAQNCENKQDVV